MAFPANIMKRSIDITMADIICDQILMSRDLNGPSTMRNCTPNQFRSFHLDYYTSIYAVRKHKTALKWNSQLARSSL